MFLMNPPPVVALQTKWGSFGQSRNFRFPVNFSESEEDITGTPINAQVQMIINNLQTDESSLDMNNEYECIMQKNRNGEQCFDELQVDDRLVKVPSKECVKVGFPVQLGSTEEEGTALGHLVLDSDSDDSVDRDIEEAIQEYLKNKSETVESHSTDAEYSRTSEDDKCFKHSVPQSSLISDMMPVNNEKDSERCIEGNLELCEKLQCVSPASDDSDDSFEESIRAEIEQFLIEKKHIETSKAESTVDKKTEPILKVKSEKCFKGPEKISTPEKHNCEEFATGQHKALKTKLQPKCLASTLITGPKRNFKDNAAVIKTPADGCPMLEQKRVHDAPPQQSVKDIVDESSGSSSDDGIEEAIQLFQMEKRKKEGKPIVNYSTLLKDQFKVTNIAHSSTHVSTFSESPKKLNRKRKRANTKSTELNRQNNAINPTIKQLKHNRASAPPVDTFAKCELKFQASARAETATELMCAEAILDISKTIMPSQMEDRDKSLEHTFNSQSIPHYSDSDSSEVDSDDSIEQEIRTFLALKAQSECVLKPEHSGPAPQNSIPLQQNYPVSSWKSSPSKTKLSLTHKRKLKEENKGAQLSEEKEYVSLVMESTQLSHQGELRNRLCQSGSGLNNCEKALDNVVGKCTQQLIPSELKAADEHVASDDLKNSMAAFDGGQKRGFLRTRERNCSGDKSSSLDSDEDLDAAIKDLLRSKRKLKKKTKDQKLQCKKKVRFGETEMKILETFDVIKQKDCSLKNPCTLKSCLLKPKETQENVNISADNLHKEKLENIESDHRLSASDHLQKDSTSVCAVTSQDEAFTQECIVESNDSSSVDSDDSIEQEIRKFLAEKAKESVSPVHHGDTQDISLSHEKVKEKYLSQYERSPEKPVEPIAVTSGGTPQLHDYSKLSEGCTGPMIYHDVELKTNQGNIESVTEANRLCGKEKVIVDKKDKCGSDHNQERLEGTNVKQTLLSADISGQSTFPVTFLGNFIAGLQYIPGKERTVLLNGQHVHSVASCMSERDANPLHSKVPLELDGQSDKSVQKSEVHVGKEKGTNQFITFPVNSLAAGKPDSMRGNVKENALPFSQARASGYCERESLVSKQTLCSVIASHHAPRLNTHKEQKSIAPAIQEDTLMLCREKVNILNETENSRQTRLTVRDPVVLKPERELECTHLKYDHRVDQGEEDVAKGPCKFNICVEESRSSGEKGKGSNVTPFSSAIDPGFTVQPYIILSPEQLCKHFYFRDCHSKTMDQERTGKTHCKI